jgi:hypothetical protein
MSSMILQTGYQQSGISYQEERREGPGSPESRRLKAESHFTGNFRLDTTPVLCQA